MSTTFVIPEEAAVKDLLGIVLGDDLGVAGGDAGDMAAQYIATYIDDEDKLVAVGGGDVNLVAYAGAALSMIPAETANDMIKRDDITPAISANFYEVMNICSRLLMSEKDGGAHLRLDKTLTPSEAASVLGELSDARKIGFDLQVPEYGPGKLSFLVT